MNIPPVTVTPSSTSTEKQVDTGSIVVTVEETPDSVEETIGNSRKLSTLNTPVEETPDSVEETITVQAPARPLEEMLKEIEMLAAWDPPSDKTKELGHVMAECRAYYPDQEQAIEQSRRKGQQAGDLLKPFYDLGVSHGKGSQEAETKLAKLQQKRPDLVWKARKNLEKGYAVRSRNAQTHQRRMQGRSVSTIKPPVHPAQSSQAPAVDPIKRPPPLVEHSALHPKDIRGLTPSPRWSLLIDETGSNFDSSAEALNPEDRTLGRLVGLLLPEQHELAPLPTGWHAVNQTIDEIDCVVQAILDAPSVGVLGVTVKQLPTTRMERWALGVLRLIDLVLRLLPLDGPTLLTVQVEQRAEFSGRMEWRAIAYNAILQLSQAYPKRAAKIECRIQVITKSGSSFNGYVDALAFIWGSRARHSRDCLKQTCLEGACFLSGDAATISRAWEWLDRGITLEGMDWAMLLAQPEASQLGSLANTILERLGQASREDVGVWQRYLSYTLGHLESKAIDLRVLGRQVEWLERWSPPGQALPPPAQLLWLTAKLARVNHLGATEQPWMNEMHRLSDRLLEENAHLVCRAELNLAVNATNRCDFTLASQVLGRWRELPKAVPGLRYWAQVQSSLGQHEAFRGKNAAAVELFNRALAAFGQLSNADEGRREARQTQTYRAIALMDDPVRTDIEVREAVELVIGSLPEAVARLAASEAEADKYLHHLLLRWLVQRREESQCAAYLEQRAYWQVGEGHPWPLIQLYRGLLLRTVEPNLARELALQGYNLTLGQEQGPLVQLIGACCRAITVAWGEPWHDADSRLASIEQALPLAQEQVVAVRQFLTQPSEPLELLRTVLPFNFH